MIHESLFFRGVFSARTAWYFLLYKTVKVSSTYFIPLGQTQAVKRRCAPTKWGSPEHERPPGKATNLKLNSNYTDSVHRQSKLHDFSCWPQYWKSLWMCCHCFYQLRESNTAGTRRVRKDLSLSLGWDSQAKTTRNSSWVKNADHLGKDRRQLLFFFFEGAQTDSTVRRNKYLKFKLLYIE